MVTRTKGHEMSVVGRRWNRDRARASNVRVTQLIGQRLQFIGREMIVIPQDVIVRWARCALGMPA